MKRNIIIASAVVAVAVVALLFVSPAIRTSVGFKVKDLTQWTPEAIRADPIGFSKFAERQLRQDLETYKTTQMSFAATLDDVAKKQRDKTKLLEDGQRFAEEFAEAIEQNVYPAVVQGREFTEAQLRTQLALTLAQVDGFAESLSQLDAIAARAEEEIRKLVVQIEKTESQLSILATKREIFKSQKTSTEGLAMLDQAKAALEDNVTVFKNNPVLTVEEMVKRLSDSSNGAAAGQERVEQFLQDYATKKGGDKKGASVQTENIPEEPAF